MASWLEAQKNSPQAMAAASATPPIRVTAPAFIAGGEAVLSIKPLLARNGQRYSADGDCDRQVFDKRRLAFALSLVFCVFGRLVAC